MNSSLAMQSKKKLTIIVASPLTENIYERISANVLSKHFEVTVLDCLDWLKSVDNRPAFSEKFGANIRKITNHRAFEDAMTEIGPDFLLDYVGRGQITRTLQEACGRVEALYITHHLLPVPTRISKDTVWKNLVSHPGATATKIFGYLVRRFTKPNPFPPDISVLAGNKSENSWVLSARKVIHTATPAYYEIQKARKICNSKIGAGLGLPDGGYILFIDDCLPLSFDFSLGVDDPIIAPEEYFPLINDLFDRLERILDLPVIIAAHPNGKEYPNYHNLFGARTVRFDETAVLSCGCSHALTHYSSAINYPVIERKPITTMTFDKLKRTSQGLSTVLIADLLKRPYLDMSKDTDDNELRAILTAPVDTEAYDSYQADYITNTPSPASHPFDTLTNYLLGLD
jgi:hypothetical protein